MHIFKKIFPIFRQYEVYLLEAIKKKLSFDAQEIFNKQIKAMNLVQRSWEDKEVNMYCTKWGIPRYDKQLLYPLILPEVKLAKVKIKYKVDNIKKSLSATLWLVEGWIFTIKFSASPKLLSKVDYEITDVEILEDPMKFIDTQIIDSENSLVINWLGEICQLIKPIKIYAPLSTKLRTEKLKELGVEFPSDWVDLIEICNGFEFGKCQVYGLYHARQISFEERELIVLVEGVEATMLVVDGSQNDGHVYFIDVENDTTELRDYGDSFHFALTKYLNISY